VQADAVKAGAARLMLLPRDSVVVLLCYGTVRMKYEKRKERKKSELIIQHPKRIGEEIQYHTVCKKRLHARTSTIVA
jgi:hypothetical protein